MAYSYDIEPAMEAAAVSLLTARSITAGGSLTTETLSTPRVDVRFELGAELPVMPANGVSNLWEGSFVFSVVTDRDRNNASHSSFRAGVRQALAATTGSEWDAAIGLSYRLLSLTHTSTNYGLQDATNGIDASVMNYAAVIQLRGT